MNGDRGRINGLLDNGSLVEKIQIEDLRMRKGTSHATTEGWQGVLGVAQVEGKAPKAQTQCCRHCRARPLWFLSETLKPSTKLK